MRAPGRAGKMHDRKVRMILLIRLHDFVHPQLQHDHADRLDVPARLAVLVVRDVRATEIEGLQVHPVQEADESHPCSCDAVGVRLVERGAFFARGASEVERFEAVGCDAGEGLFGVADYGAAGA